MKKYLKLPIEIMMVLTVLLTGCNTEPTGGDTPPLDDFYDGAGVAYEAYNLIGSWKTESTNEYETLPWDYEETLTVQDINGQWIAEYKFKDSEAEITETGAYAEYWNVPINEFHPAATDVTCKNMKWTIRLLNEDEYRYIFFTLEEPNKVFMVIVYDDGNECRVTTHNMYRLDEVLAVG